MEPKDPNDEQFTGYHVIKTDGLSQKEIAENILDVLSNIHFVETPIEKPVLTWESIFPPGIVPVQNIHYTVHLDGSISLSKYKDNVVDFAEAKRRLRPKFLTSL